jgi:hypothetical protein
MSDTAPAVTDARIDLFRDRLDGGVEHHVAQLHGDERIVATLRLEPVLAAPLRTLAQIGAPVLPDTEGAFVTLSAEGDAAGHAGLTLATLGALASRRRDADDAFWLAGCPDALVQAAIELGWRALPRAPGTPPSSGTPLVLLVDDVAHLEAIDSPLAAIPPRATPRPIAPSVLLEALGLPAPTAQVRRAGTGG